MLAGVSGNLFSQHSINEGTINKYGRVTAIGIDNVTIPDPTQFSYFNAGDTVLLIQMKGVECLVPDDFTYGQYQISTGTTGIYEFLTVLSVGSNIVTFRNNISNTYSLPGDVQLVRVPSFNAAKVDAELTCAPWDSTTKTGGVLSLFVGTTLTLNANINAKGKGLKGGDPVLGDGICIQISGLDNYFFPLSYSNSGLKGEGLTSFAYPSLNPIFPLYAKGKGPNFTGGGGGSGKFSGGGGGSLVGTGGKGGLESKTCGTQEFGGLGGKISPVLLSAGVHLGGGGGGSTYLSGATPSSGGRGGCIIIIVCQTLDGNGKSILAEGETPTTASGNSGSGGGGGGGTIALYLQNFSSNTVTLSANGGAGGNNAGQFGEGGGGGGGRIEVSNITIPGTVTRTVAGGLHGTRSGIGYEATSGSAGDKLTNFAPLLNGFLFNSIYSLVTKNQVDSICSDTFMGEISGTQPIGATLPITYLWESSVTSATAGFSPAPGTNNLANYTPPAKLTQTTWFRRTITDSHPTPIVDVSKAVEIIVQQAITGNLVGKDTTICYNQNPNKLYPLNSGPSNGNGHYAFQWSSSPDNSAFTDIAVSGTIKDYDPAALSATTYYKRKVTSGRCVDNSASVTITVLSPITGNITSRPDSIICQGSLFNTLGASAAGGGSGSYIYQWQDSTASSVWAAAAGTNANTTYDADTSKFASIEDRWYKRIVYSGLNNTCQSISVPIHLTRYHKIINNSISADQIICSGFVPTPLTGTTPAQGNLIYTYQWQDSTKSSAIWTDVGTAQTPYAPPALTDTTWYRRIVNSSKCTDKSNKIAIGVHKPIANNVASLISGAGPDTTICSSAVPNKIIGSVPSGGTDIAGSYAYQWSSSTDDITYTDIFLAATLKDYNPGALTVTTWFRRKTISGMCSSYSNSIKVIVLPPITNNVVTVSKSAVCYNTVPAAITGTALTGGAGGTPAWIWQQSTDGTTWLTATGTSDQQNYSPAALLVKTWYRRIIRSGLYDCCIDTSNVVIIDINPLPTGTITSVADTTICSGSQVKLRVNLTGTPGWTLVYNENSAQVTVNSISSSPATISRIPAVSAALTTFNYSLASITDNNGCDATLMNGARKADVYKVPAANAGTDDEVCGPKYILKASPSVGTGQWYFPPQVLAAVTGDPHTIVKIDSSFSSAYVSYKFYWEEKNWLCVNKDSVTITFDNRIDTINAGPGGQIVTFDNIAKVNAYPLLSYEAGKWTIVVGSGDFEDDTKSSTYVRNIAIGNNIYKWTVHNKICVLEDTVLFDVLSPVISEGISPDGNGINDTLKITGLDFSNQDVDLTILNSAGTRVFSTTNRNGSVWTNWDGKNSKGSDLPEGTYYYLLKVASGKTGHISKKSGFIILKRH